MKFRLVILALLTGFGSGAHGLAQETIRVLAYSGQALPGGGRVANLTLPRVNAVGRIVFLMTDGGVRLLPWVADGERLTPLVPAGMRFEGLPDGVTVQTATGTDGSGWLGLGRSGAVATYVRLEGAGVTDSNALAIMIVGAAGGRVVARAGDPLPGGTGRYAQVSTLQPPLPVLNARDEVAFSMPNSPATHPYLRTVIAGNAANLVQWRTGLSAGVSLLDDGQVVGVGESDAGFSLVFQGPPTAPVSILAAGDPAPGLAGEVVAESNFQLAAEPQGRLAIAGRARRAGEFSSRLVVWEGVPGRFVVALRENDIIDGFVVREIDSLRNNAAGMLAARAYLAESTTAAERTLAIIVRSAGTWQIVARGGATAPGEGSGRFTNFDGPVLNALGQVVFPAIVTGGTTQHGLWGGPVQDIRALVRSGDAILLPSGERKTVGLVGGFGTSGGSPAFGQAGGVTPLGDNGVLAQRVSFSDNSLAVLAVSLPLARPVLADDRLINISTRAQVDGGDNQLVAGFVVSGSAPQRFLIRGLGPVLANFGVTGVLAAPELRVFRGAEELARNRGWTTAANAAEIGAAAGSVGAFPLPGGAADSALVLSLPAGSYTAQLGPATGTGGVGLIEVYHVRDGAAPGRPVNLSSRAFVGRGAGILIPGIVVAGSAPKTLLIRAVGPTLAADFGLAGALADPGVVIYSGDLAVAANDDWGAGPSAAILRSAAALVGAFPLREGAKDAALLVTLSPGNYTVQVAGRNDTTGLALVEVYELGAP